jgi:hypothetical protein
MQTLLFAFGILHFLSDFMTAAAATLYSSESAGSVPVKLLC